MEGPTCIGCQKFIEEGSVIAFGESLFHIKCFACAKCNEAVDCDSNLLLLSNGKPVCENCSYLCHACKQVIRDEAIMTGDDAYHAECFQCVSCKKKIEDLVFTQTSKGIHCTPCHEKRKAEKQRRREEREKRLQLKQQHKQAQTEASDRAQQQQQQQQQPVQLNTSIIPPSSAPATDPPTPSRSRSNSIEDSHGKYLHKPSSATAPPTTTTPNSPPSTTSDYNMTVNTTPSPKSPNSPPLSISSPTTTTKSMTAAAVDHIPSTLIDKPATPMLELDSLNLSFFDNDSSDLVNLTKQLGANISMDIYGNHIVNNNTISDNKQSSAQQQKADNKTTENRITRASQLLESSLVMMSDFAMDGFPSPPPKDYSISTTATTPNTCNNTIVTTNQQHQNKPSSPLSTSVFSAPDTPSPSSSLLTNSTANTSTVESSLRAELQAAQAKIQALQTSHEKIKDASRKALDELSRAKEEFSKEVQLRQQQEYLIHQLKHQLHIAYQSERFTRSELSVITKEEIERVAHIRVELDKTCNELKNYRNLLIQDINALSTSNHNDKLSTMLSNSFKLDQEQLRTEIKHLEEIRDDILHEMVMLNTKNAELTEMNNDLSRRMTEREREAAAVMAGMPFIYNSAGASNNSQLGVSPTPSISSEIHASSAMLMQRKSSEASIRNFYPLQQQQQQQQATPKMFKLKKKGGNMFSKLSGKSKAANNANAISENAAAAAIMYGHHNQQHQQQYYNTSSTLSLLATNNNNSANLNASSLPLNPSSCSSSSKASLENQHQQQQQQQQQQLQQQQHGSHLFLPTSFLRPSTKCDACGDKMWGFVTNELRCQHCLYTTHARCLSFVPQLCQAATNGSSLMLSESTLQMQRPSNESDISNTTGGVAITTDSVTSTTASSAANSNMNSTNTQPSPPARMKLFGTDLSERAQFENRTIPYIIEQCIRAVEKRGMDYEGIYRKSGGAAQIRTIVQAFENMDYHPAPPLDSSSTSSSSSSTSSSSVSTTAFDQLIPPLNLQDDEEINDICAVTSVLKQYFRDLPNPLIPYNLYTLFIEAVSKHSGASQVDTFSELLSKLPQINYDTLRVLVQHLHQIQSKHHENLMTIKNLAMVFGPTLLRDEEANRDLIDMSFKNAVVEVLITHVEVLFLSKH